MRTGPCKFSTRHTSHPLTSHTTPESTYSLLELYPGGHVDSRLAPKLRWRRCEHLSAVDRAGRGPGDAVCLCGCVCPQIHGTKSQMIIYLRTCTADRMCPFQPFLSFPFNTYVAAAPTPPDNRTTGPTDRRACSRTAMCNDTQNTQDEPQRHEPRMAERTHLDSVLRPAAAAAGISCPSRSALDRTGAAAASSKVALPQSHARHPARSVQL